MLSLVTNIAVRTLELTSGSNLEMDDLSKGIQGIKLYASSQKLPCFFPVKTDRYRCPRLVRDQSRPCQTHLEPAPMPSQKARTRTRILPLRH